jgi:5'-nucleotidase
LGVWLVREKEVSDDGEENGMSTPRLFDLEPIQRENEVRKYNIVTREYLAEGHDGYITFKGKKHLIDHEGGNLMSAIVRRYFLGENFAS